MIVLSDSLTYMEIHVYSTLHVAYVIVGRKNSDKQYTQSHEHTCIYMYTSTKLYVYM